MRADTKKRKNATQMLRATQEQEWWADQVVHVMLEGKRALDAAMLDVGRLVAETLMYMEREERSGPDYHPTSSGLRKWASQRSMSVTRSSLSSTLSLLRFRGHVC